ncbi:MAG: hypothetical protein CVU65_07895 [Deltaproteobacteria bacterium HGW-Deltaproteobacteria-22]|nr:MAG: hypothetical protein CVU65_07895 [Deltaproteobacteria bacterium HGW-Deltaproteobacteria-22]
MIFMSSHHAISDGGFWIWKNKAVDSFRRSPKLAANVLKSIVNLPVQENQVLSTRPVITFDENRVQRVLIRITKGLLFHYYPDAPTKGLHFEVVDFEPTQELVDGFYQNMVYDERGRGVFRFWRVLFPEDPRTGHWVFVFFDGAAFLVSHEPEEREVKIRENPSFISLTSDVLIKNQF